VLDGEGVAGFGARLRPVRVVGAHLEARLPRTPPPDGVRALPLSHSPLVDLAAAARPAVHDAEHQVEARGSLEGRDDSDAVVGEELTALGRGLTTWKGWEISGWGGSLYGDVTGAFGAAGSLGSWAVRGEGVLRDVEGEVILRGTLGVDHQFRPYDRDLYLVVEYQHDGLGASGTEDYVALFGTDPFLRGELQVLGRDETAVQASYQIHPLWSLATLGLWNLRDGSFLLSPSFAYSLSNEASATGGVFFGFGDEAVTPATPLPSEYGAIGITAYFSLIIFF